MVFRVAAIHISFVIPTLDQSGAERQLCHLACGLHQRQISVDVIALNRGGYYERPLQELGIPVSILQKRFRFDPLTWQRLRHTLHQRQPEIVQSFLFAANAYVRLPGVCPASSKIVISERCVDTWKSGWQKRMDRYQRRRMARMTTNSRAVADFYQHEIGVAAEDIDVIPNGIDTSEHSSGRPPSIDLRAELGLSPETRLVGFVGRLAAQKCLRDLIWAFHLLFQALEQQAALVLMGDGPERNDLAEFARSVGCRDSVYFTGHRDDARELLGQLNAFCLPSAFEGMSNSLMEAMAAGVPAVVSDIAANTELVRHEHTGLVVPVGDSVAMGKALRRLLTDTELAQTLASRAVTQIREEHSVSKMVDRYQQLYEDLLKA